jgi:hypothetical protein
MKRLIVLSLLTAVTFLTGGSVALAHAQDSAKDDTPTFYRIAPGTYVGGWPRFTIHYPKDWLEEVPMWGEAFRVSAPKLRAGFGVTVASFPPPLDKFADAVVPMLKAGGYTDVTIVSDKPSRLRDGTPAQEVDFRFADNGAPCNFLVLATKRGDVVVNAHLAWPGEKIAEEQRAIVYSLEFQPGHDEPVKVPDDVKKLLDSTCSTNVAHDLPRLMADYSDRYLNSGARKGEMERFHQQIIGRETTCEIGITDFVAAGDRAYLAGFVSGWFGKAMLQETSIIKENGEWKWYGNQREAHPWK